MKIENKINSLELTEQINFFRKQYDDKKELEHKDLLKIIRSEFEEEINQGKISPVSYKDKKGENRPMYILTLSQAKQVLVRESKSVRKATIKYIEELENQLTTKSKKVISAEDLEIKKQKLEIMDRNAKIRMSNQFLKIAKLTNDEKYKDVLIANSANCLSDVQLLELPKLEQKTYTATEIATLLNTTAHRIGKLSNEYNLKTDEFGCWYHDKSRYSNKHVESFRYYKNAIDVFRDLV